MKTLIFTSICLITVQLVFAQDQFRGYKKITFDKKSGISKEYVSVIMDDTLNDATWIKTFDEIFKFNNDTLFTFKKEKGKIAKYSFSKKSNNITNLDRYLVSVFSEKKYWVDNKNNLWILDNDQLIKFNGSKIHKYFIEFDYLNDIETITEDRNGVVWISLKTKGLLRLSDEKFSPVTYITGNEVYLTTIDSENKIWFFSNDGITILNGENVTKFSNESANINYHVSSFLEINDSIIWLSSHKGHTSCFNGKNWTALNILKTYWAGGVYTQHAGNAGMSYADCILGSQMAGDNEASVFPSMIIMNNKGGLYLQDCDNKIYNLNNPNHPIFSTINYPWKSNLKVYFGNSYRERSSSFIWNNVSKLTNKFIKLLSVEEINNIYWPDLYLFHIDHNNNIYFKANDHITILKKI